MTTRFSEPEAAEIDAARGNTDRSEWLRTIALAAARAIPGDAMRAALSDGDWRHFAGQPEATRPAGCPHRINRGAYCKICERTKT